MIDPMTGLFEIVQNNYEQEATIANIVEQAWICRYPIPTIIAYNWGNEFLGCVLRTDLIQKYNGIKPKCATAENPQGNSILERIHPVVENPCEYV